MENEKKKYSVDELLKYAYKRNQIPEILFAKDKECRYIFTSEIEALINGGEENSILGKTDMDIQYDPEFGKMYYEQDQEIIRTGKPCHCYSEFIENGRIVYKEIAKNPVYVNGEIIGVCGVVSDVTELIYIRGSANLLADVIPDRGICIRWGGDEFLVITPACSQEEHEGQIKRIRNARKKFAEMDPRAGISVGGVLRTQLNVSENEILKIADKRMYEEKMFRRKQKPEVAEKPQQDCLNLRIAVCDDESQI